MNLKHGDYSAVLFKWFSTNNRSH